MACLRCPYTLNYQLLWQDAGDPEVIAVLLRCCAGPELQIRRGPTVLLSEIFKTPLAVVSRAEELRGTFVRPCRDQSDEVHFSDLPELHQVRVEADL